ncbi:hypothetical protein Sjap_008586 [Stephania japonica]|uniref:Uncharacterized protein n=1 Tax=Stephania japonica TaxID=461633 RepID=A0AAP0PBH7_9MAGN
MAAKRSKRGSSDEGIMARVSKSEIAKQGKRAASDAAFVTKKLLLSTGKAAWFAGITFLILVVPLIVEMDREQQLNELELQQSRLLGTPSPPSPSQ